MHIKQFAHQWKTTKEEPSLSHLSIEDQRDIFKKSLILAIKSKSPIALEKLLHSNLSKTLMPIFAPKEGPSLFASKKINPWWAAFMDSIHDTTPSEPQMRAMVDFLHTKKEVLLVGRSFPHIDRTRVCGLLLFLREHNFSSLIDEVLDRANRKDKEQYLKNTVLNLGLMSAITPPAYPVPSYSFVEQTMAKTGLTIPKTKQVYEHLIRYMLFKSTEKDTIRIIKTTDPNYLVSQLGAYMLETRSQTKPPSLLFYENLDTILSCLSHESHLNLHKYFTKKGIMPQSIPQVLKDAHNNVTTQKMLSESVKATWQEKPSPKKPKM